MKALGLIRALALVAITVVATAGLNVDYAEAQINPNANGPDLSKYIAPAVAIL